MIGPTALVIKVGKTSSSVGGNKSFSHLFRRKKGGVAPLATYSRLGKTSSSQSRALFTFFFAIDRMAGKKKLWEGGSE